MTETIRFVNATVFQGLGLPLLDSLTITGDRVVDWRTEPDRIVDCEGGAILPAFGDAHCHPLLAARAALGPNLNDCASIEQIRDSVRAWALANPEAPWIVGGFYDRDLAPQGRFSRHLLDDLDERPIVLQAADQHAIWVNTAALEVAGLLDGSHPFGVDLEGSEPLGTLREDAKQFLLGFVPEPSPSTLARSIERQLDYLASLGIVHAMDAWVDEAGIRAYAQVESPVQVELALWVTPDSDLSTIEPDRDVKLFVDGVIGSATAMVREDYLCDTSHPRGVSSWQRADFERAVLTLATGNRNVFIHAIGDAAIDWVISAAATPHRVFIEHGEMLSEDQIEIIAKKGIGVCFQPLWARNDAMMANAILNLGNQRAEKMYPLAELDLAGGAFAFGSDWPVSSADPLLGIYTAVTRQVPGGNSIHNESNRISLERAIAAYTTGDTDAKPGAREIRQPRTLEVGARADFVIIGGDPFKDIELLAELKVEQTFSGGKVIFSRH